MFHDILLSLYPKIGKMKRNFILAAVAVILLALMISPAILVGLIVILIAYFIVRGKNSDKKNEPLNHNVPSKEMSSEEITKEYGEADDIIITDATRANEPAGTIMVYKSKRILIIAGEPVSMDDIADVSTVNTATPYTIGQQQVVFATRNKQRQYIRLDVGYDAEWARHVATELLDILSGKESKAPKEKQ